MIPWGLALEDFLTPNQLTLEDFCTDFTGSWVFGYADALRSAGARTVIVCFAEGVRRVTRRVHRATGTEICVIPLPRVYRLLRSGMRTPYGRTVAQAFALATPIRIALYPILAATKEIAPFLATPVRTLGRELRRYGCGALLCQEYEFPRSDVCVAWGRLHGIPVYDSFQGGDYQRWRLERITRPTAVRLAAGLVIPAEREVDRVRARYGRERGIARIPNPIDLRAWHPHDRSAARRELGIAEGARVAAWHGRVDVRKKGLDTLVEAWASLASSFGDEAVLLLIGTGRDSSDVHRRIDDLGLRNVVWIDEYLHEPERIARLLAAADVYVFPSRHEGFPLAPVEAMACGLPVVSCDANGIEDVLRDGERSGGVVVPRDRPEHLARELTRLLADPALGRRLGTAAMRRAADFDRARVGEQLRSLFFGEAGAPATRSESPD